MAATKACSPKDFPDAEQTDGIGLVVHENPPLSPETARHLGGSLVTSWSSYTLRLPDSICFRTLWTWRTEQ